LRLMFIRFTERGTRTERSAFRSSSVTVHGAGHALRTAPTFSYRNYGRYEDFG